MYICTNCSNKLKIFKDFLLCNKCKNQYPINAAGIPIFEQISFNNEKIESKSRTFNNSKLYDLNVSIKYWITKDKKVIEDVNFFNNKSLLNVGCGPNPTHPNLEYNIDQLKNIHCCDTSENYVIAAKTLNIKNSTFSVCSIEKLPFEDDSFDIVFAGFVFHHTTIDFKKMLNELKRVSKKYVIVFDHVASKNIIAKFVQNFQWKNFDKGFQYKDKNEWNEILNKEKIYNKCTTGIIFKHVFKFCLIK